MTDLDPAGRQCVSLTVEGEWAHFRRVDTTNDKQTYRIMPRTTVAGFLAAILGEPRDSYYDRFTQESSAIAIVPTRRLRTMQVPMLTVPTAAGDIQTAAGVSGKTVVPPEVLEQERKRRAFEYLRSPEYRIHVVLDDETWMDRLIERLDTVDDADDRDNVSPEVQAVYTPALGKTECLAEITESVVGEVESSAIASSVDSTVPETKLTPTTEVSYAMERSPGFMTTDEGGRKTTGFLSYAYPTDGQGIEVDQVEVHRVNGDAVCFL